MTTTPHNKRPSGEGDVGASKRVKADLLGPQNQREDDGTTGPLDGDHHANFALFPSVAKNLEPFQQSAEDVAFAAPDRVDVE